MVLDPENTNYSRKGNIIYENKTPIVLLHQEFIDIPKLSESVINYMNRYLEMFPEHFETIKDNKQMKKPSIIKMFYDLETTGTDVRKHSIHQISGVIEVNSEVVEDFDFKVRPNPKAKIDQEALDICDVTEEQILAYPEMKTVYKLVLKMLGKYVNRFDRKDKMWLLGFNNRNFDDVFFRAWFEQNGDAYFGSWFWSDSIDAMVLASEYLQDRRYKMSNFKLKTVAKELGITVDESKLHDAAYDIWLTREIYLIVTGRIMEPNDELF